MPVSEGGGPALGLVLQRSSTDLGWEGPSLQSRLRLSLKVSRARTCDGQREGCRRGILL